MIFEPDIFSDSKPKWKLLKDDELSLFEELVKFIPNNYFSKLSLGYCSGAFEINSSNYKLEDSNKNIIILKKWPRNKTIIEVNKIQELINWLYSKNIPVPKSGIFIDNYFAFNFQNSIWSHNVFKDGDYYSGIDGEFENVAIVTAKLHQALKKIPLKISPKIGFKYFSKQDNLVFDKIRKSRNSLEKFLSKEHSFFLNYHWDYLFSCWESLKNDKVFSGDSIPCHFDMHPHNLITKNSEISEILDFDSVNIMPIGYSLAFNALKQCRQYISLDNEISNYKQVGDLYISNLFSEFKMKEIENYNFCKLSKTEVLRRICNIFSANLIHKNKSWNHILPVQIAHLYESDKLF